MSWLCNQANLCSTTLLNRAQLNAEFFYLKQSRKFTVDTGCCSSCCAAPWLCRLVHVVEILQYSLFLHYKLHCVHLWLWTAHVPLPWLVNPTDMLWPRSAWSIWMCHYTHCPVVPFNALDILDHACMSHTCMFWAITKSQRWRERNSVCENPIQTNAWTHSAQVWELWRSYRTNSIISFPLYCTEFHSTAQTCSKTLT